MAHRVCCVTMGKKLKEIKQGKAGRYSVMKTTISTEFGIYGDEVAELFWELSDRQQAIFFNVLGSKKKLPFQLQYIQDLPQIRGGLSDKGKEAMRMIGEYSGK